MIIRCVRTLCNSSIRLAKDNYTKSQLDKYEKDPYRFWQVIESTGCSGTGNPNTSINLIDQNTKVQVPQEEIPNYLTNYLHNVGAKLASQFENAPPFHSVFHHALESFMFRPMQPWEVRDLVKSIKTTKSSAIAGLISRVLSSFSRTNCATCSTCH